MFILDFKTEKLIKMYFFLSNDDSRDLSTFGETSNMECCAFFRFQSPLFHFETTASQIKIRPNFEVFEPHL